MKWIWPEEKADDILTFILQKRGIIDVEKFLKPSQEHLNNPLLMHDMQKAAEAILQAIKDKKKIFIHGDFDVDGITATTILWSYLFRDLGANVMPFIPSRFDEGYGLSDSSIQQIIEQGGQLLITVDCGVKDIELVSKYKDQIDFIITDHHTLLPSVEENSKLKTKNSKQVGEHLISADALAVVHPKLGGMYPFTEISGAMVAWKLVCAINEFAEKKIDIRKYIDLAALGTVCDVMPLVDENRIVVAEGLKKIRTECNTGLRALLFAAGISNPGEVQTYHFGYILGPRLNAAGRLEDALDAVRLLSTTSEAKATHYASYLHGLNTQRQDLTQELMIKAEEQVQQQIEDRLFFIIGDDWSEGIVGLIAGNIQKKYNRPTLVATKSKEHIKGSARSFEEFHIANVLKDLSHRLIRHGGHAGAAGFTLSPNELEKFVTELKQKAAELISDDHLETKIYIDVQTDLDNITLELAEQLQQLEPFGKANEEPVFGIKDVQIVQHSFIGSQKNHVKLVLKQGSKIVYGIAFNKATEFAPLLSSEKKLFDIAGTIGVNEWNGNKEVQLKVLSIA